MISRNRLAAPREHLGVLIEADQSRFSPHPRPIDRISMLDTKVGALRDELLKDVGCTRPVFATGHQPEFFHAGVFAKTIAIDLWSANSPHGRTPACGASVFLAVDSDLLKSAKLVVPTVVNGAAAQESVPLPGFEARLPAEFQSRAPRSAWDQFFRRVVALLPPERRDLLQPFRDGFMSSDGAETIDAVAGVLRGQSAVERALGLCPSTPLRLSALAESRAFRCFFAWWALNARSFATEYNAAQASYRDRHQIRSIARPVPPLEISERAECPFWLVRAGEPRRRVYALDRDDAIEFFADDVRVGSLARAELAGVVDSQPTPLHFEGGWRIRPRALTLSAFARLFLADVFVHGVGGALYDEMTDEFMARVLASPLPAGACVSATTYYSFPGAEASGAAAQAAVSPRELRNNPQRVLRDLPEALLREREARVREIVALQSGPQRLDRARRRSNFLALRQINDALRQSAPDAVESLVELWKSRGATDAEDRARRAREYFFALHDGGTMRALVERIRDAQGGLK